jgi:hypothetical protein
VELTAFELPDLHHVHLPQFADRADGHLEQRTRIADRGDLDERPRQPLRALGDLPALLGQLPHRLLDRRRRILQRRHQLRPDRAGRLQPQQSSDDAAGEGHRDHRLHVLGRLDEDVLVAGIGLEMHRASHPVCGAEAAPVRQQPVDRLDIAPLRPQRQHVAVRHVDGHQRLLTQPLPQQRAGRVIDLVGRAVAGERAAEISFPRVRRHGVEVDHSWILSGTTTRHARRM